VRIVRYARGVMNRRGDRRKQILVTEIAWPAFVPVDQLQKAGRSKVEKIQSDWLEATIRSLVLDRRALNIGSILWYTWMSRDASPNYTFDYSGLVRLEAGNHVVDKPALGRFSGMVRKLERRR
jgi:hypothetical protein